MLGLQVPRVLTRQARLERAIRARTRNGVIAGPFRGMPYVAASFGSVHLPKLLGTYEMEVAPFVERLVGIEPQKVCVAGAAEGYYAVGLARRCAGASVIAWESDADARTELLKLARLNRVDEKISIRGECIGSDLEAGLQGAQRRLVIMDVEGAELELVDLGKVPGLTGAHLIIETHDFIAPGTRDLLAERLLPTHVVERVDQARRKLTDLRGLHVPAGMESGVLAILSEKRPRENGWLVCTPRTTR